MKTPPSEIPRPTVQRARLLVSLLVGALFVLADPLAARAHDRGTSYSSWEIRGREVRVVGRVTELDLSRFPWAMEAGGNYDELVGRYLTSHLQLSAGGTSCQQRLPPRRLDAPPGRLVYEWHVTCPPQGLLEVRSNLFLDVAPSHLHFARVRRDDASPQEKLLSEAEAAWLLDPPQDPSATADHGGTTFAGYVALGIEHILTGYDHLAFVLALLLIGGSFGDVARVVTGFTIAHSITLGLTVLGYVQPDNAPVEALIGLSIFLVAAENSWLLSTRPRSLPWGIAAALAALAVLAVMGHGRAPAPTLAGLALFCLCYFELLRRVSRHHSLRWAVAFLFGLIHGFGFAAVLGEAGLPPERIVPALLGFNLGVEIGQLAVVALIWPLLRALLRIRNAAIGSSVIEISSAAVAGLGLYWFVTRTFG